MSWQDAIEELAADDGARQELAAVAGRLEAHAAPCGTAYVVELLSPLVSLYGVPDKSEGEWRAFWRFYTEALSDLPREAMKAGVSEYVGRSDSEFFPKPGPLKAICSRHAIPIRMAANRAQKAMERSS